MKYLKVQVTHRGDDPVTGPVEVQAYIDGRPMLEKFVLNRGQCCYWYEPVNFEKEKMTYLITVESSLMVVQRDVDVAPLHPRPAAGAPAAPAAR